MISEHNPVFKEIQRCKQIEEREFTYSIIDNSTEEVLSSNIIDNVVAKIELEYYLMSNPEAIIIKSFHKNV